MNDQTTTRGRQMRGWALPGLLVMAFTGCGSNNPGITFPDYLSPESRELLLDAQHDLIGCQSAQAAAAFAELLSLSDPVGYAAAMATQSVAQGKPDLPAEGSLQLMTKIDEACCLAIEKRIDQHSVNYVIPKFKKKRGSKEYQFFRKLSTFVGSGEGRCRLPDQMDPDLGWPSG